METSEKTRVIYEFGTFVLDPQEKTLFAKGVPVHLPVKEFETLLLLVEHNGKALSKEEMMSALWQDAFVEENNLAKHISQIRKFLNTKGQKYIETLPKHGYRFSAEVRQIIQSAEETILEKRIVKKLTVRLEEETDDTPPVLPSAKRKFPLIFGIGLAIFVLIAGIWFWNRTTTSTKINSMAVLPLRPLTEGENSKALGLGLTDALITKIGSLRSVAVRPTSAVIRFTDSDPLETGKKLNVDAVLEGTIQQADGRIRINARLLKVANGEQIWAESFDQPENEIFALQDALSIKIARTLAFELNKTDFTRHPTKNPDAYEKYLRGRFYQSQNTEQGLTKAIEFYEQAIALDVGFAEPYAGIADAKTILYDFGLRSAAETLPKAKQNLNRAFQLNANLPDAYNSLALIQFLGEHDWQAAEQSLQKAIELDPNNANAYLRYGYFLINVGQFDDAAAKLDRARELNPLSPLIHSDIGLNYLCARRYPQAIEQLEKTTAENPDFPLSYWFLGAAYEGSGADEKAFNAYMRGMETEGGAELANRLRSVKETEGLETANQVWLDEWLKVREKEYVSALNIASLYATLKNREQTLTWLEKASGEQERMLSEINFTTKYDFVRDEERFQRIVRKIEFK